MAAVAEGQQQQQMEGLGLGPGGSGQEEGNGNGASPTLTIIPMAGFLTEEELLQIPEPVRVRLYEWSAGVENTAHNFRSVKDTEVAKLGSSVTELESQIRSLHNELSKTSRDLEEAGQKYRASVSKIAEVEESALGFQKQAAESQLKADIIAREKDELVFVVSKRNEEIERLTNTVKNLSDQLQSSTVAKIEALVKVDELTGKDLELEYKEKQLEREKEWVAKQVQLLTDELDKKQAEIINVQREFNIKHLQLSSEISEKDEQIRIAELSLENVKKANEAQEKHIEHLITKLKDAEDIETKMQENYRQELAAQRKIAELYKDSSEEASKKVEELEDAVSNLQDLLKNATTKYGELETKFINTCKYYQDEVAQRDEEISKIKKELENANKLIENFQSKGLTDEMIQSLSPAAAAATSMLKNTKSLTQIYSEYHDLCNEVIIKKQETVKLNQMVKELLQEIQTQGPELESEKLKNQKNLERLEILQNQLDLALRESGKAKTESAQLKKSLGVMERENSRLRAQLNDLAMQVRSLLKETEVQRGNYSAVASRGSVSSGIAEVPDIESSAQQVVSDRLVTFKNIEELQMQNQRLLAVVRELTESQEKATREAHENQLQLIKDSFKEAMRELEVLREKRMSQEKLLESVSKQRDTLAELLKQQKSPVKVADPGTASRLAEIQRQYEYLQTSHKSLQEEYDTYKKERAEHEKLAVEQTEKLRDDVMKMRTENAKLASQVEYNNERTKIYNSNLETYKKNINILEERNKKYSATTLKLEQSLDLLKTELSSAQQKLARTEVALNSMTQERNALRDTNSRLQAERDLLKRDQSTQQMLRLNLQEIKNGLEMSNSAVKSKMESEIDNLQKENAILRRKVSTETERFKEAVFSWESANKELIERLRNDQDSLQATKEQLENSKATIARLTGQIDDLQSQVKVLSNTTLETVNASNEQPVTIPALERQIKDLQSQLRDAKIENETTNQHLLLARQSAEEYRTLCASVEGQISVVTDTSKQLTDELQQRLEGKDELIRDLQSRLTNAEREGAELKDKMNALARDLETKTVNMDEEINRMKRDLQAANSKLQSAYEENVRVKLDLEKQTLVYKDIQDKYERELASHGQDVTTMNDLKNELETLKLRITEEEQLRRNADSQLTKAADDWTNKENQLKTELARLNESKNELETINTTLQDQIISMTTRMENANKTTTEDEGEGGTAAGEGGESESESQKSSEQWLQLIRYLRREKEIAKTKTEMSEATCSRYENQIKHLEKQADDLRKELLELKDRSHVSIITSAKQADLLRKVETLSALTDSNRMLREEKENAVRELQQLKERFSVIEVEIGPLREKSSELEARCESLLNENTALKQDVGRWRTRASALLEKSNKINPEEMKRLQTENDNLQKQVQMIQENSKKQQMEVARQLQQIKLLQQQTSSLQQNNQALQNDKKVLQEQERKSAEEREKAKSDMQSLRLEVSSLKNAQVKKDETIENLNAELENVNKILEETRNSLKTIKNIARRYKKQFEDLQKEVQAGGTGANIAAGQDASADAGSLGGEAVEALKEENIKYETQVKQLQEEIETLKKEAETVKTDRGQNDERLKNVLKTLREKLNTTTTQKTEVEAELNEARTKISSMEVTAEETSSRFAALKSQFEGRISRLEKENRELKVVTESASGNASEVIVVLQQKNEEQKKELDMLKQRLAAVENRYKLQSQTTKVVSPEKVVPVEKAKANIRPIPGTSPKPGPAARPPLTASIRPISMTRKATVSVSAMPTQTNQQASSSNVQSTLSAAVVAPVSQAQVSTSTPDQSSSSAPESSPQQQMHQMGVNAAGSTSSAPISSQVRQAAAVQPTVTVAPVAVGSAGVVIGGSSSSTGSGSGGPSASSQVGTGMGGSGGTQSQQSNSTSSSTGGSVPSSAGIGSNTTDAQAGHQDPSTSSAGQMLEESEMGDSSEQVSSSEGSTHQNILSVAPLRSKQHDAQQSSSSTIQHQQPQPGPSKKQGSGSTEEPSPSSSSLRPSQSSSNKRIRGDDGDSQHEDEEDLLSEPENKRTRVMGSIDREAEALGQHESSNDQMLEDEEEEEEEEREADQGSSSAADDAQVQRSDTTTMQGSTSSGRNDDDDDSDVIVIESDDEDGTGEVTSKATTSRGNKSNIIEEDDVEDIEEEEDVMDEEEPEEEEDIMDEEDDVDDDDDDDDQGDDGQDDKARHVDYEEMEGQEGREAESLEHDDDIHEVHGEAENDREDILDSNDSLNPVDFSQEHEQGSQQHELREAEQSIDDEDEDAREVVQEPMGAAPVPSVSGSPIRTPRDLNIIRPQNISSPMRLSPSGRGGVPPLVGRHQHQQMLTPSYSAGQYSEDADDSIVPGTPTLYVPRRSDNDFAVAVSSPQIQPGGRFTFHGMSANEGSSGSTLGGPNASSGSGSTGLDDSRISMDFLSYDDGGSGTTGRSVPSTPLQVSPPVEGVELSHEMQADEETAQEENISAAVGVDVHPTSSTVASVLGNDVPAITVTSAMESSSGISFQGSLDGSSKGTIEAARLAALNSQPRTSTQSEVSSVTSSDEDKVPVVAGSSSTQNTVSIQQPSTSSRAASPTTSFNPPTEQKEPVPQPQQQQQQQQQHHHHHHQQGGRPRPTPIVWDQPSSSSSSNPISRPIRGGLMGSRGATMAVRHMIQPDQGHIMAPMMMRGSYRAPILRGAQSQSARRSRPHHRGGPAGAGPAGPGPGGIGGRMPFQKPY